MEPVDVEKYLKSEIEKKNNLILLDEFQIPEQTGSKSIFPFWLQERSCEYFFIRSGRSNNCITYIGRQKNY
jgi:hypothetical protein